MSYVVQNFYFLNKKLTLNLRTKSYLSLNNLPQTKIFWKFYTLQNPLFARFGTRRVIFYLLQHLSLYSSIFLYYKNLFYAPLNHSNNLYLSAIYWQLKLLNLSNQELTQHIVFSKNDAIKLRFWGSLQLHHSEINRNVYDKVVYFYWVSNHFLWTHWTQSFTIFRSYLFIQPLFQINVFFNTLFFYIYNF